MYSRSRRAGKRSSENLYFGMLHNQLKPRGRGRRMLGEGRDCNYAESESIIESIVLESIEDAFRFSGTLCSPSNAMGVMLYPLDNQ